MRTLIFTLAIGLASANLFAQDAYYEVEDPNVPDSLPTSADYHKVDVSFSRLKLIYPNELIEAYCPKLVNERGLDATKSLVFDIGCTETAGDSTKTKKGENSPILHVTEINHADYIRCNPDGPQFSFKDMFQPGNLHLGLIVLDWWATTTVYDNFEMRTDEQIYRTWNGGNLGARDELTEDYFVNTKEDGWQKHKARIKKTRANCAKFRMFRKIRVAMEKSGRGVMLAIMK